MSKHLFAETFEGCDRERFSHIHSVLSKALTEIWEYVDAEDILPTDAELACIQCVGEIFGAGRLRRMCKRIKEDQSGEASH